MVDFKVIMRSMNNYLLNIQKIVTRYRFVLLLFAVAILFLPQVEPVEGEAPRFVYFLGRFHPLVIHFPIVLVALALLFEIAKRFNLWSVSPATIGFVLGAGLLGSMGSLGMGFMLYYTGEYVGEVMQQHLWGGVLLTAFLSIACFLFLSYSQSKSKVIDIFFFFFLFLANLVLIYTSHQGGSLTHGSEYLTEYMPQFTKMEDNWKPKPVEEMLMYDDMIAPFLDKKCMSCHNENKAKGGLVMTSYEALLKGGKGDHPALTPGSSIESDMYRRVMLPLRDDDHMPPEGKVPLTEDEISLLSWWIENGADPGLKVTEASQNLEIQPLVQDYIVELKAQQHASYLQKQSRENLIKQASTRDNYVLGLDPYDEKGITLSMPFPPSAFSDNDLLAVQPIFSSITKASFIGCDITDDSFYHIGQMTALRELYLQQTKITGAGLVHLSKLQNLKLLDLSKTEINNGQLLHILHFPSLEDLYINETKISKELIEALKENQPDLNIHLERGKIF